MEFLVIGVVVLPDNASPEDIAKFQAKIVSNIRLEEAATFYGICPRNPLVYWRFTPLDPPLPINWRDDAKKST